MLVSRTFDPLTKIHRRPRGQEVLSKLEFKLILRKMRNECCNSRRPLTCVCHALLFYERRFLGTTGPIVRLALEKQIPRTVRLSRHRSYRQVLSQTLKLMPISGKRGRNGTGAPDWDKKVRLTGLLCDLIC